jgi:hypothetical protein
LAKVVLATMAQSEQTAAVEVLGDFVQATFGGRDANEGRIRAYSHRELQLGVHVSVAVGEFEKHQQPRRTILQQVSKDRV